jgi:hypothetical protein
MIWDFFKSCYLFIYICNMITSTHQDIAKIIEQTEPGKIFFPTDFRGTGSEAAIKMSLSRLVKEGKIERLAQGIYLHAKIHPVIGKLQPSLDEIAEAIAEKEHIRIQPSGAYALNKLGLSDQVPTRLVYITDGQAKQIRIGEGSIKFKPTSPKKFGMIGKISGLVIQGLEEIGPKQITPIMKDKIAALLKKEDPKKLGHDIKLAPAWINDFFISLNFKKNVHD